jgi:hypothetical protein
MPNPDELHASKPLQLELAAKQQMNVMTVRICFASRHYGM